jgi:serine/threonine-protein kinase
MPQAGWGHWLGSARRRAATPRTLLIAAGLFAALFGVGYLVSALIIFPTPLSGHPQTVPRVIGLSSADAETAITKAHLRALRPTSAPHPSVPRGAVIWQDPPPDVVVAAGTEIETVVSTGPQPLQVPDLVGYDVVFARSLLVAAGLNVGPVQTAQTNVPKDVVVNTRPSAGASLPPGSQVSLVVSAGEPTITVPTVIGLTLSQTRAALEQAGLTLGTYFAKTPPAGTSATPGTVIDQEPKGGTLAAPGTPVTVHLARRGS